MPVKVDSAGEYRNRCRAACETYCMTWTNNSAVPVAITLAMAENQMTFFAQSHLRGNSQRVTISDRPFSKPRAQSMVPYAFLSLALWPLVCCGDECRVGLVCTSVSILLAVIVFVIAQLVRELWLLRSLRGYQ